MITIHVYQKPRKLSSTQLPPRYLLVKLQPQFHIPVISLSWMVSWHNNVQYEEFGWGGVLVLVVVVVGGGGCWYGGLDSGRNSIKARQVDITLLHAII